MTYLTEHPLSSFTAELTPPRRAGTGVRKVNESLSCRSRLLADYGESMEDEGLSIISNTHEAPNPGDLKGAEPPFLAAPRPKGGVAASLV